MQEALLVSHLKVLVGVAGLSWRTETTVVPVAAKISALNLPGIRKRERISKLFGSNSDRKMSNRVVAWQIRILVLSQQMVKAPKTTSIKVEAQPSDSHLTLTLQRRTKLAIIEN